MKKLEIYNPNLLLEKLNINKVPNIGKVIKESGIRVIKTPDLGIKGYRAIAAINTEENENTIYINKKISTTSRRFLATYMYAYIQLYYKEVDDGLFYPSLCEEESFDRKAYNFALRLLMPEKMFKSDVEKEFDNKKLSKKYKVSMYVVNERRKLIERDSQKVKFKVIQGRKR